MARAASAKAELLQIVPGFTIAQARAADQPSPPEYPKLAAKYYYAGLIASLIGVNVVGEVPLEMPVT